ncbi:MAG: hypothetical protein HY667_05475 [Chloroflexi bacterium]|nr:hypothetical protein [Chloroflexota bacterium]
MKCSKCGREITEDESYVQNNRVYCDDCLMDIGLTSRECDPWATYIDKRTQKLARNATALTETEQQIYDFVKGKGKVTRADVMANFRFTDTELSLQLTPLLHFDMVKEVSEQGKRYLSVPEQPEVP